MTVPVWLEKHWTQLQSNAKSDRLGHAILLTGPMGVGKRLLADELIRLALCGQGAVPACGECRSCHVAAAGNHPDFHELAELDGKSTIGIAQVRELTDQLSLSATYQNRKIGLITPAEHMTPNAANALLKTLEEPPGHTLIVLLSHQAWRLPATIISRCQLIHCAVPRPDVAIKWLNEQTGAADWEICLQLASGAPLQAIKYKNQKVEELFEGIIEDLIQLTSGREDVVSTAVKWNDAHLSLRLSSLYKLMRLLVLVSMGLEGELAHKSAFKALHNAVLHIKLSALLGYQDAVLQTRRKLDTPLNPQLMLEELLAPWSIGFRRYELECVDT